MNDTLAITWSEKVQGIPNHAPLYTDDLLVILLLGCFFIMAAVLSDKDGFLGGILKGFFLPREDSSEEGFNTLRGLYMRLGMLVVSFFSVAVLISAYISQRPIIPHLNELPLTAVICKHSGLKQCQFITLHFCTSVCSGSRGLSHGAHSLLLGP